jgi:branched-chain amino acid transport system substrate-binding protein
MKLPTGIGMRGWLILLFLLFSSAASAEPAAVKVGVLLTLTGTMANWGQSAQNALVLAQEKINAQALADGGVRFDLIFEDYGNFDLKQAASAAQKLVNVDHVDVLFSYLTEDTEVVWKIASGREVPVIAMAAGGEDVTKGRPHVYRTSPSDIDLMAAASRFVAAQKKSKTCILNQQISYFQSMAAYLDKEWTSRSNIPPFKLEAAPQEKDFRTTITKFRAKKCDALFALLLPDAIGPFLQQANELKFKPLIFGPPGTGDPAVTSLPSSLTDGLLFARFERPTADFMNLYEKRFGQKPDVTADYAFDALHILRSVVLRFGRSHSEIEEGLLQVKGYHGASGTIDIRPDRTRSTRNVQIWEIRDGSIKLMKEP